MGENGFAYAKDVAALLKDADTAVQISAAWNLGRMGRPAIPYARDVIALIAADSRAEIPGFEVSRAGLRGCFAEAFVKFGNANADWNVQAAALDAARHFPDDEILGYRASLYVASGHSDDLIRSVRWLGRSAVNPMPDGGLDAPETLAVLTVLSKLWEHTKEYPGLRKELCERLGEVAGRMSWAPDTATKKVLGDLAEKLKADKQPASAATHTAVLKALGKQ